MLVYRWLPGQLRNGSYSMPIVCKTSKEVFDAVMIPLLFKVWLSRACQVWNN